MVIKVIVQCKFKVPGCTNALTLTTQVDMDPGSSGSLTNSALVTEISRNFIESSAAVCQSTNSVLLVCDLADVVVNHCDATVSCNNSGQVHSITCNADEAAQAMADAFAKAQLSPAQLQAMDTLTTPIVNGPYFTGNKGTYTPSNSGSVAAAYITNRCFSSGYTRQSVTFPLVQLTDCTDVTVTGLNSMDATTRCAIGALSELIPPESVLLTAPTSYALPLWENPLLLTLVVAGGLILLAVIAGAGMHLRAKDFVPKPSTVQKIQLVTTRS